MSDRTLSRRSFLKGTAAWLGSALVIGVAGPLGPKGVVLATAAEMQTFAPSDFIAIDADGVISLVCHRSEMGQGIRTAMVMLLAEELDVPLSAVYLVQADGDPKYGDQNTDGSRSVERNWTRLRKAGAAARAMLVEAAARKWQVAAESCRTEAGRVCHDASGRKATYGELVPAAALLPMPANPTLKAPSDFRLLGKPQTGLDVETIVAGRATFGMDVRVPEMVYASIERSPVMAGRLRRLDDKAARAVAGVLDVVRLSPIGDPSMTNAAVAVVATSTWAAIKGRQALQIEWERPNLRGSKELRAAMDQALAQPGKVFRNEGDVEASLKGAAKVLEADYRAPYLVHAPMEPLACTADVRRHRCEIWAPAQDPQRARSAVSQLLNLPVEKIAFHVTMLGGGFGRKSQPDFVLEAVAVSRAVKRPVKVVWTREDEIKHGFYHAESRQRLTAAIDGRGKLVGWRHRSVFPTIAALFVPGLARPFLPHDNEVNEFEMNMGAANLPYVIPNWRAEGTAIESDVRVGWLRSVCNLFHSFAVNGFLDEIAQETKQDPVQLRLALLKGEPIPVWDEKADFPLDRRRLAHVIEVAARESGWGRKLPQGTGVGFAAHYSFRSYVAMAVEAVVNDGVVEVKDVYCAFDCGQMVNPDSVKAQMEGAIAFGLSAALYGEITLDNGRVQQSNFHDYPVLRMPEAPRVHVHLVQSEARPTGVGEPGVPPVAPALCNAIYAAVGKRIRTLPIGQQLAEG